MGNYYEILVRKVGGERHYETSRDIWEAKEKADKYKKEYPNAEVYVFEYDYRGIAYEA